MQGILPGAVINSELGEASSVCWLKKFGQVFINMVDQ